MIQIMIKGTNMKSKVFLTSRVSPGCPGSHQVLCMQHSSYIDHNHYYCFRQSDITGRSGRKRRGEWKRERVKKMGKERRGEKEISIHS